MAALMAFINFGVIRRTTLVFLRTSLLSTLMLAVHFVVGGGLWISALIAALLVALLCRSRRMSLRLIGLSLTHSMVLALGGCVIVSP